MDATKFQTLAAGAGGFLSGLLSFKERFDGALIILLAIVVLFGGLWFDTAAATFMILIGLRKVIAGA